MSPIQPFRQHIPNLLTLCNLALGFTSAVLAFEGRLIIASWLILLAAGFDFLDGFAAKLLGAVSKLGKQLDSLADIISFGMAPAARHIPLPGPTSVSVHDNGHVLRHRDRRFGRVRLDCFRHMLFSRSARFPCL